MKKIASDVDIWLSRETVHTRKALENASSYFDNKDVLTVNTLEAIYGQESSFGTQLRKRGIKGAAGEFHLQKDTAERYQLIVSKTNDQRFDIDYASTASARYLKELDTMYAKRTILAANRVTIPIKSSLDRKMFVLAAYNAGEGTIAFAQSLAQQAGEDPTDWNNVQEFLSATSIKPEKVTQIRQYVDNVLKNEAEFAIKSLADKAAKNKKVHKPKTPCTSGHWITKDGHHIFICD